MAPLVARQTLPLLAVARARHQRETAAVAVSGVVASLSLAVALTVMVASFRESVTQWLDQVLPADLYVRSAATWAPATRCISAPNLCRPPRSLPGVKQLQAQRVVPLLLQAQPAAGGADRPRAERPGAKACPWWATPLPVPAGQIGIYVSEAVVDLHGATAGPGLSPNLTRLLGL